MPVIPTIKISWGLLGQPSSFEDSVGYTVSSRVAWTTEWNPSQNQNQITREYLTKHWASQSYGTSKWQKGKSNLHTWLKRLWLTATKGLSINNNSPSTYLQHSMLPYFCFVTVLFASETLTTMPDRNNVLKEDFFWFNFRDIQFAIEGNAWQMSSVVHGDKSI